MQVNGITIKKESTKLNRTISQGYSFAMVTHDRGLHLSEAGVTALSSVVTTDTTRCQLTRRQYRLIELALQKKLHYCVRHVETTPNEGKHNLVEQTKQSTASSLAEPNGLMGRPGTKRMCDTWKTVSTTLARHLKSNRHQPVEAVQGPSTKSLIGQRPCTDAGSGGVSHLLSCIVSKA